MSRLQRPTEVVANRPRRSSSVRTVFCVRPRWERIVSRQVRSVGATSGAIAS